MHRSHPGIDGSILILVSGMAALLLTMAVAVLVSARTLSGPSAIVLAEAQNRITLGSALMHLQETSRMGWGSGPGDMSYGWTDVRDGQAGPRGPANSSGTISLQGWTPGGTYPAEGGVFRGDMYAWQLPPCATQPNPAPNPFQLNPADAVQSVWAPVVSQPAPPDFPTFDSRTNGGSSTFLPYWLRGSQYTQTQGAGPYIGQPVMSTYVSFLAGDRRPRPESVGLTWFRIYRELPADHDGDGSPWYDTIPIAGHGTFIVTVGAGSTRGFRFWDASTDFLNGRTSLPAGLNACSAVIEPQTASASSLFIDQQAFRNARLNERIAWYRVQWSANSSAGLDTLVNSMIRDNPTQDYLSGTMTRQAPPKDYNATPHYGGAIRWVQRLEQEPPTW